MPSTEIRQKLHQQIDQLPADLLIFVADFLDFLKFKLASYPKPASSDIVSTGADLLKFAGTWQGDDFDDCLQAVYENRTKTEF